MENQRPRPIRIGRISASYQTFPSENGPVERFTVQKSYKKDDKWCSTPWFSPEELPQAAMAAVLMTIRYYLAPAYGLEANIDGEATDSEESEALQAA